jgi:uncharacterized protein
MLCNVAQLLKEGVGASRRLELVGELHDIDENNAGATPVKVNITLVCIPTGVLVTGTAKLKLTQACRRCLELSEAEATLQIEEEFRPSIDIETGAPLPIGDDVDPELVIDEHHILDLTEVVRQLAMVEGAGYGLCQPGCKGLCPSCGSNLNLGPCTCAPTQGDPRLAVLAKLLASQDDEE